MELCRIHREGPSAESGKGARSPRTLRSASKLAIEVFLKFHHEFFLTQNGVFGRLLERWQGLHQHFFELLQSNFDPRLVMEASFFLGQDQSQAQRSLPPDSQCLAVRKDENDAPDSAAAPAAPAAGPLLEVVTKSLEGSRCSLLAAVD